MVVTIINTSDQDFQYVKFRMASTETNPAIDDTVLMNSSMIKGILVVNLLFRTQLRMLLAYRY